MPAAPSVRAAADASSPGNWSLIVAVKDDEVLRTTLLKSPDIDCRCQFIRKSGFRSAATAYNEGIREANNEILVFAHTDVYLPKGWLGRLVSALLRLSVIDPSWGVLGVSGMTESGKVGGYVYSTGLKSICGGAFDDPIETVSLDELLLITRRSSGLNFDEKLPGFHLYGTDICLEARRRGLKSYIIPAFCIHNSNGFRALPLAFWRSYFYMRKKWWRELPVRTPCAMISRSWWPVVQPLRTTCRRLLSPSAVGTRSAEPELLCENVLLSRERRLLDKGSDSGPRGR